MGCFKFSHIGVNGEKVFVPKISYNTQDEAIVIAKVMNLQPKQLTKAVAYHCSYCNKYHVGRNGKAITPKYLKQITHNTY